MRELIRGTTLVSILFSMACTKAFVHEPDQGVDGSTGQDQGTNEDHGVDVLPPDVPELPPVDMFVGPPPDGCAPTEEVCNGEDDDCDGLTDERIAAPFCENQVGVCAGATRICGGANGWRPCDDRRYNQNNPGWTPVENAIHCDGRDNDCDGEADEGCECRPDDTQDCGVDVGECQAGLQRCNNGTFGDCSGRGPERETCDGLDEDCDGQADEGCDPPPDPCAPCGTCGRLDCWLWYSPSNAARAGGHLPDFRDLFTEDNLWPVARSMTGVLLMKMISLRQLLEDDFIEAHLVPKLNQWNMRLAFDVSGATWASCLADRNGRLNAEAAVISRIIAAGGRVEFLGLQSVLSKPLPNPLPNSLSTNCPPYTMEQRFGDVLWYINEMKGRFPGIKVGLIDAQLAHGDDAAAVFGQLAQHLEMGGQTMDFILLDHPYHYGEREGVTSWTSVRDLAVYIRNELGLPAGLFHVSSLGGRESERRFHDETLASQDRYAEAGGHMEYHVVSSWYPNPTTELPENAAAPRYPLTKVLRGLGERVIATNTVPHGRFGRVDDQGRVHGWAVDADTPLVSIRVRLSMDGPLGEGVDLGEFLADGARPDVNDATGLPGDHGFIIPLPAQARDGRAHDLYVYGVDSRDMGAPALIEGSPQPSTVAP